MKLTKGKTYKITGNTYPNRNELQSIGASWDKDEKCYHLDLSSHSNTAIGKINGTVFTLSRKGVIFTES